MESVNPLTENSFLLSSIPDPLSGDPLPVDSATQSLTQDRITGFTGNTLGGFNAEPETLIGGGSGLTSSFDERLGRSHPSSKDSSTNLIGQEHSLLVEEPDSLVRSGSVTRSKRRTNRANKPLRPTENRYTLKGTRKGDRFVLSGDYNKITAKGLAGDDRFTIRRSSGNKHMLRGGRGNDVFDVALNEGRNIRLDGGAGRDTFIVAKKSAPNKAPRILDFQHGEDILSFKKWTAGDLLLVSKGQNNTLVQTKQGQKIVFLKDVSVNEFSQADIDGATICLGLDTPTGGDKDNGLIPGTQSTDNESTPETSQPTDNESTPETSQPTDSNMPDPDDPIWGQTGESDGGSANLFGLNYEFSIPERTSSGELRSDEDGNSSDLNGTFSGAIRDFSGSIFNTSPSYLFISDEDVGIEGQYLNLQATFIEEGSRLTLPNGTPIKTLLYDPGTGLFSFWEIEEPVAESDRIEYTITGPALEEKGILEWTLILKNPDSLNAIDKTKAVNSISYIISDVLPKFDYGQSYPSPEQVYPSFGQPEYNMFYENYVVAKDDIRISFDFSYASENLSFDDGEVLYLDPSNTYVGEAPPVVIVSSNNDGSSNITSSNITLSQSSERNVVIGSFDNGGNVGETSSNTMISQDGERNIFIGSLDSAGNASETSSNTAISQNGEINVVRLSSGDSSNNTDEASSPVGILYLDKATELAGVPYAVSINKPLGYFLNGDDSYTLD